MLGSTRQDAADLQARAPTRALDLRDGVATAFGASSILRRSGTGMGEKEPTAVRRRLRAGEGENLGLEALTAFAEPILGFSAFDSPDVSLVAAVSRAGATGVLDLGRDPKRAAEALAEAASAIPDGFGVRIQSGTRLEQLDLPEQATLVVCEPGVSLGTFRRARCSSRSPRSTRRARPRPPAPPGSSRRAREPAAASARRPRSCCSSSSSPRSTCRSGCRAASACTPPRRASPAAPPASCSTASSRSSRESELPRRRCARPSRRWTAARPSSIGGYRVYTRPDLPVVGARPTSQPVADRLGADLEHDAPADRPGRRLRAPARRHVRDGGRRRARASARAIAEHRRARPARSSPLAPGSPFATRHGTSATRSPRAR